jgi:hypothetical protein
MTAVIIPIDGAPEWTLSSSGWVGETCQELIQKVLNRKQKSNSIFPKEINLRWLLIVCDGSVDASLLTLHSGLDNEVYESHFDRVFIIDFTGKRYKELLLSQ